MGEKRFKKELYAFIRGFLSFCSILLIFFVILYVASILYHIGGI